MTFRVLGVGITALMFGLVISAAAASAGTVVIKTKVVDHAMESMTITCPAADGQPAITVDLDTVLDNMTEQQMDHFMEVVNQFESQNGVQIESETVMEGNEILSDTIDSTSTGPDTGIGQELCDLVRLHSGGGATSSSSSEGSGTSATSGSSSESTGSATTTPGRSGTGATRGGSTRTRPGREAGGSGAGARSASQSAGSGSVTITTHVENHATEGWTISCPAGNGYPAITIDVDDLFDNMTVAEMEHFADLVSQFESENGVSIESTTVTDDDGNVVSDNIHSSSTGPSTGAGAELCDLVRKHSGSSRRGNRSRDRSDRSEGRSGNGGATHADTWSGDRAAASPESGEVLITSLADGMRYVGGNIGCPQIGRSPAFDMDIVEVLDQMNPRQEKQLMDLIRSFEMGDQVVTQSDSAVDGDRVITESSGSATGTGRQICNLIRRYV